VKRRTLLAGLCAASLLPSTVRAQTAATVHRIGLLAPGHAPYLDMVISSLGERGWHAGQNLLIETRFTQGDSQRAEAFTREFAALEVRLILTNFTATAIAAHRVTKTIPIVMMSSGFPVEGGLARSLARPGGNVTGVTIYAGGGVLFGKFVQLLHELVPSMRELGVLWGYAPPSYTDAQVAPATEELRRAASALGLKMRFWKTGRGSDLDAALAAAAEAPPDALFVTSGVIHGLPDPASRIAELVVRRRLPVLTDGTNPLFHRAGVLAYTSNQGERAARVAYYVDRVLRGTRPGELPIEQPTEYELSVNLKVAGSIGLTIPQSILARADRRVD